MSHLTTIQRKRQEWIDMCKGFAIIVVVLGHIVDGYRHTDIFLAYSQTLQTMYDIIYSFHMALFYVLSGIVFGIAYVRNKKWERVREQIFNLILCYLTFSCLIWAFKFFLSNDVNNPVGVLDFVMIPIRPISPYWYLYNLILYYTLLYFWSIREKGIGEFELVVFLSIISLLSKWLPMMKGNLQNICYYMVFFYVGLLIGNNEYRTFLRKIIPACVIISSISLISIIVFGMNIRRIPVISNLSAMAISLFVIYCFMSKDGKSNKKPILNTLGKYSLEIYLIHCYITALWRVVLLKLNVDNILICFMIPLITGVTVPIMISVILHRLSLYEIVFKPYFVIKNRRIRGN